jgi:tetratricopeptide (TPR) repeat protein
MKKAVAAFEEARTIDPGFALASVGLGDSYIVIGAEWYGKDPENPPDIAMTKARAAAREALTLDPNLAEAYVTRAYIQFLHDWDWEASEKDFVKAIELDPDYVVAHQWYSEFLGVMGRHDESIAESTRAVELDPTSALQVRGLARSFSQAGRLAEAIEQLKRADELVYSHPSTMYSFTLSYWAAGMREEAIVAAYRWDERWGRFYELLADAKFNDAIASLESFADGELTDQNWINCYILAGDKDRAVALLEDFFHRRYMTLPQVLTDPILAPLSEEPRVVELRRSLGL